MASTRWLGSHTSDPSDGWTKKKKQKTNSHPGTRTKKKKRPQSPPYSSQLNPFSSHWGVDTIHVHIFVMFIFVYHHHLQLTNGIVGTLPTSGQRRI